MTFHHILIAGAVLLAGSFAPGQAQPAPKGENAMTSDSRTSEPFTRRSPDAPHWTIRDGLSVALHPQAIHGTDDGGPRGLIRLGLPLRPEDDHPFLLNFVAVEPVTMDGRRGFSELERSPADGRPGLRFWVDRTERHGNTLRLIIRMDKFVNGAHPFVIATLRASRPHEVQFQVYAEPDSAPMRMCILTATMGNYQRLRRLHLADRVVHVNDALPQDPGPHFTPHAVFPLEQMARDRDGAIVRADSDEKDSREVSKTGKMDWFWAYLGANFVQYWRQPAPVDPDLRVVVNARKMYWGSEIAIPGGKSYENFELNATYRPGQTFIYGVTPPK